LDKSEKESYYELLNSEISFSRHFLWKFIYEFEVWFRPEFLIFLEKVGNLKMWAHKCMIQIHK
jgi:hypothetical protein